MKKITIDDLEWQKDPHYFTPSRTKSYYGKARDVQVIVIHWWNDPDRAGTLEPTADYLERADTSIHFIVSGDRVIQMVNMGNTAFHARSANPISVGIEVDPNTPGNTYETVGALVRFIRTYYGDIPLKRHSDYVDTTCPGTIDLNKIERYANNQVEEKPMSSDRFIKEQYLMGLHRKPDTGGLKTYRQQAPEAVSHAIFTSAERKRVLKREAEQDKLRTEQRELIAKIQNELQVVKHARETEQQKAATRADKLSAKVSELQAKIVRLEAEAQEEGSPGQAQPLTWQRVIDFVLNKLGR